MKPKWIVVTDFDGTLSQLDIGNEIAGETTPARFQDLHAQYKSGALNLKDYQKLLWTKFPLAEAPFRARARHFGAMRPGVDEFLRRCAKLGVPVFVASCGLLPYIEEALDHHLSPEARAAIREIRSNEASFDAQGISEFRPPASAPGCPYPLDKGEWARELAARFPGSKILGIGNGTSDRSFWPKVDRLAASEGLARWAAREGVPFLPFTDFRDLLNFDFG